MATCVVHTADQLEPLCLADRRDRGDHDRREPEAAVVLLPECPSQRAQQVLLSGARCDVSAIDVGLYAGAEAVSADRQVEENAADWRKWLRVLALR